MSTVYNSFVPVVQVNPAGEPPAPTGGALGGAVERQRQSPFDDPPSSLSNPPFTFLRTITPLVDHHNPNVEPRILRGYIRRSTISPTDPNSTSRLYFMFNPTVIQRSYIAYLDQQALDPTNTTFNSGNLAAAPGLLDFTFELFFDRQAEVGLTSPLPGIPQDVLDRGVLTDYDYFDRVVRGVDPDNPKHSKIPDNGVMMVNPNTITVVFNEDLAVTGRAYNASVQFEKFSHRMVPTRMRIGIQMKVTHIGPTIPSTDISDISSEAVYQATVPYEQSVNVVASIKNVYDNLTLEGDQAASSSAAESTAGGAGSGSGVAATPGPAGSVPQGVCTPEQVGKLILATGMRGLKAAIMLAIGWRESNFNSMAHNPVPPDNSYGLFQINMLGSLGPARLKQFNIPNNEALFDPATSVRCMYILSSNGTNFQPWVIDANTGRATVAGYDLVHLNEAKQIISQLGGGV